MSSPLVPTQNSRALRWLATFLVAIAAFALGGWIFWSKPLSPSATPTASSASATTPNGESKAAGATVAAVANASWRDAGKDEMLAALRAKLSGPLEDVLKSLAEIAKTRPALAIDLAQALGRTDEEKSAWVTNVMQQWADQDSQAAWQWLGQQSSQRVDELAGGELPRVVIGTMAARDPKRVISNLDTLLRLGNPSNSVSTPVAVHLGLGALVENGQIDLARSVVDGWAKDPLKLNLEAAAFETVAMSLAKTAPRETGEWLRSMPPSEERNAAIATFTATWAEHDPRAALQWAEALSPQEGQHAALRRTVSDWIESRPDEIGAWLTEHLSTAPANAEADSLVNTVINLSPTVKNSPQLALKWVDLISDPVKRKTSEENIALQWGRQDRAAAIDYVQKSPTISSERKAALLQQIQIEALPSPPEE